MDPERGGGGRNWPSGHSLENHEAIGILWNTGLDPKGNHKANQPAFNVGPSLVCKGNAIFNK